MRKFLSRLVIALPLLCGSAIVASGQGNAQARLLKTYESEPMRSAQLGVLALKMNGDTVAVLNPSRKLVPASNMKLLTTGIVLDRFGSDYRFTTSIGYSGEVRDSVLHGDLYIIGGGDPTTGSRNGKAENITILFGKWTSMVRAAGINRIEGMVIGDPRYLNPHTAENNGWTYEDIGTSDGAAPRGLNFFENKQTFYITPGAAQGTPPFVHPRYPDTPWMKYEVRAVTSAAGTKNTLYYVNSDFGPHGEIRGRYPIDRKGYTLECSNKFGALTCAFHFYKYLYAKGIKADAGYGDISPQGYVRHEPDFNQGHTKACNADNLTIIGSTRSEPMSSIVANTNKKSDNFYAETLMHLVGLDMNGSAEYSECVDSYEKALASMGLRTGNLCTIYDGSGLSRKNYVAPEFFVKFLKAMRSKKAYPAYLESLPYPGEAKGTLEYRFSRYPDTLKKRIRCKTGSMNGIRCYSGYILSSDGNPDNDIVFSVMSNNTSGHLSYISTILEEIIAAIAEEN